jgi:mono/diheme cytochrome c family protein
MNWVTYLCYPLAIVSFGILTQCSEARTETAVEQASTDASALPEAQQNNQTLLKQGEHLVLIAGCHDCHTPKKMTDKGPVIDMSLALSGHPANMPPPDVDRAEIESKGLAVTQTLTAWVGPWGISLRI